MHNNKMPCTKKQTNDCLNKNATCKKLSLLAPMACKLVKKTTLCYYPELKQ